MNFQGQATDTSYINSLDPAQATINNSGSRSRGYKATGLTHTRRGINLDKTPCTFTKWSAAYKILASNNFYTHREACFFVLVLFIWVKM